MKAHELLERPISEIPQDKLSLVVKLQKLLVKQTGCEARLSAAIKVTEEKQEALSAVGLEILQVIEEIDGSNN